MSTTDDTTIEIDHRSATALISIQINNMRMWPHHLSVIELQRLLEQNGDRTDVDPKALAAIRDELAQRAAPTQHPHYSPLRYEGLLDIEMYNDELEQREINSDELSFADWRATR
jgi:hypothetical protein